MPNLRRDFDQVAIVIDWLDACRHHDLEALLDLYAQDASLECECDRQKLCRGHHHCRNIGGPDSMPFRPMPLRSRRSLHAPAGWSSTISVTKASPSASSCLHGGREDHANALRIRGAKRIAGISTLALPPDDEASLAVARAPLHQFSELHRFLRMLGALRRCDCRLPNQIDAPLCRGPALCNAQAVAERCASHADRQTATDVGPVPIALKPKRPAERAHPFVHSGQSPAKRLIGGKSDAVRRISRPLPGSLRSPPPRASRLRWRVEARW